MDNRKYLINFLILFVLIYLFLKNFEGYMAKFLAFIIGYILNSPVFENSVIYNNSLFTIIPACTCSFEISLFLAYVLATPKTSIKPKIIYSIFGLFVINITNILRIIFIIKNSDVLNYKLLHDLISFIIFPVALILNVIWIKILLNIGVINKQK